MQNLYRRGGMWWARLSVPPRLRNAAGRSEFTKSTRTHDLTIAKMVAAAYLSVWRGKLLALESPAMPEIDVLKIVQSAHEFTGDGYLTLSEAEAKSGIPAKRFIEAAGSGRVSMYVRLSAVAGYRVNLASLEPIDPERGRSAGVVIPPPNSMPANAEPDVVSDYLRLSDCREIAKAIIAEELTELEVVAYDLPQGGGWKFVPNAVQRMPVQTLSLSSSAVSTMRSAIAAHLDPKQIERIQQTSLESPQPNTANRKGWGHRLYSEVVNDYCSQPGGMRATLESDMEVRQRKAGLMLFAEFMGDCKIHEVNGDMLRAFRDGPLKTLPANSNHLPKELRMPTMSATIAKLDLEESEWPKMTSGMQAERMKWIMRMFTWLKQKEYLDHDPAAALRGETGLTKAEIKAARRAHKKTGDHEDEDGRDPFTSEELSLIFGQAHYRGEGIPIRHGNEALYPFNYWLPLLGLYAGCRIKEASQLYLRDVRKINEFWFLDINESTPDKKLKNEQSTRLIALHPHLIELGFLEYCEALTAAGYKRVFPELTCVESDARYGKESGRKMSKMLKSLGMPRDGSKVFHCLRHNFNNALTRVTAAQIGIDDDKLRQAIRYKTTGHKFPDDVNMSVYLRATPYELHRMVSAVSYPEVNVEKGFEIEPALASIAVALSKKHGHRKNREDFGSNTEFDAPAL